MTRGLLTSIAIGLPLAACLIANSHSEKEGPGKAERIYSENPASWFEDAWKWASVSKDKKWAIYGRRGGIKLIELDTGREDSNRLKGSLQEIANAVFYGENQLARLGRRGTVTGWFEPGTPELRHALLPPDALPQWSPDGAYVAWYRAGEPAHGLFLGNGHTEKSFKFGGNITGFTWSADGSALYALIWHADGITSLVHVNRQSGQVKTIANDLDAAPYFNSLGVSPDGKQVFVALASRGRPRNEARHEPRAHRNLNIYQVDPADGNHRVKIQAETDVFAPTVAGGYLYWTRNEIRGSVVVLPSSGGTAHQVIQEGELPRWERPGGKRLAFTYGGWRLADWALNLDAGVVDVDAEARPVSMMRPIVTGYHEDFTPAWSPDGNWIAYHSHRSRLPVPAYASEGSADDIFLRHAARGSEDERRLTDFGMEVGPADWSPDGRKLVFCSWERSGKPGVSKPWIVTIDPGSGRVLRTERFPLPEPIEGAEEVSWSPKGDEIAIEAKTGEDRRAIWIVSLDGKKAQKLIDYRSSTYGGIAWTPDGKRIVYAGLAGGRTQLFAIVRSGGLPQQLSHDVDNLLHPCVSPDGAWIACTRMWQSKEIWRMKL